MGRTAIRRVVVGLDLAPSGDEIADGASLAVERTLQLATAIGARVTVLHSTHGGEYFDQAEGGRLWRTEQGLSTSARMALDDVVRRLSAAGLEADLVLEDRPAWVAIVDYVETHDIDLVVVGKRSYGDFDFDARKLGTVALRLMRRCPCAVWTVRPGGGERVERIVAATDLSRDVGRRVIEQGAWLASVLGAELHLLHACALSWSEALVADGAERTVRLAAVQRHAKAKMARQLEDSGWGVEAQVHLPGRRPARSVYDTAVQVDAGLVVMGTVSRSGLAGVLVGNTAERMLGMLDRSLWTLKPRGFEAPAMR